MKLDIRSFALTCAIWWGLGLLVGTWWIILLDGAHTIGKLASGDPPQMVPVAGLARLHRKVDERFAQQLDPNSWATFLQQNS